MCSRYRPFVAPASVLSTLLSHSDPPIVGVGQRRGACRDSPEYLQVFSDLLPHISAAGLDNATAPFMAISRRPNNERQVLRNSAEFLKTFGRIADALPLHRTGSPSVDNLLLLSSRPRTHVILSISAPRMPNVEVTKRPGFRPAISYKMLTLASCASQTAASPPGARDSGRKFSAAFIIKSLVRINCSAGATARAAIGEYVGIQEGIASYGARSRRPAVEGPQRRARQRIHQSARRPNSGRRAPFMELGPPGAPYIDAPLPSRICGSVSQVSPDARSKLPARRISERAFSVRSRAIRPIDAAPAHSRSYSAKLRDEPL